MLSIVHVRRDLDWCLMLLWQVVVGCLVDLLVRMDHMVM
jgi:hypothetical protein